LKGAFFSDKQRRLSAPGAGKPERSRGDLSAGPQAPDKRLLAPAADRDQTVSLHRREFSAATLRSLVRGLEAYAGSAGQSARSGRAAGRDPPEYRHPEFCDCGRVDRENRRRSKGCSGGISGQDRRPAVTLVDLARGISVGTLDRPASGRSTADRLGLGAGLTLPDPGAPWESKTSATPTGRVSRPARSKRRPPSSV